MKSLTVFTNASQQLAARLFSRGRTQADKQRGASALEYIVLAAAIIFIVGILATNETVQTTLETAFNNLFTEAQGVADSAGDDAGG
jgi:Flp pilus assembly pilin Flp